MAESELERALDAARQLMRPGQVSYGAEAGLARALLSLEARERELREALDRLVDAAEPFVPETRYSDELGDVLEGAIEIAREALRSLDSEGGG
jgi:hypothetical protein